MIDSSAESDQKELFNQTLLPEAACFAFNWTHGGDEEHPAAHRCFLDLRVGGDKSNSLEWSWDGDRS